MIMPAPRNEIKIRPVRPEAPRGDLLGWFEDLNDAFLFPKADPGAWRLATLRQAGVRGRATSLTDEDLMLAGLAVG